MSKTQYSLNDAKAECEKMAKSYKCLVEHLGENQDFNQQLYEKYTMWASWFGALEEIRRKELYGKLDSVMDKVNGLGGQDAAEEDD